MQLSETNFNTWATKGHLVSLSHDYEAAMLAYERALALRPGDSSTKVQQARVLLELGRTEEAEQRLTQLHNANPRAPLINYLRAVAAVQRGELETAKAALLSVLSVAPGHPERYLLLAAIYLQERNFEEAEASVQNVLDVTPEYLPGIKLLAAIQVEQGRAEEAIETLKSVLSDVPDDVQALGLLGSAYMQVGEFDKANQALSQAAKLAPDVAIIRTQLALSEFGTGKSEEALAQLSAVTAANPSFVQADLLIVSVHLERREFAEALEAAVKFAEKQPDNPMPHNLMGGAYEGLGDIALAREAFERALALDAHFVAAVLNLARLDLIAGDKTGASERYTQALERNPHHHAVLSRLAALAFDAGDTARGVELLEESRRHNPTDVLSRLTLSRWHLQTGHSAAALPVAEEAFALAPEMPRTILALSRAELLNGKGDSAVSRLTTLSKDYPESIEALFQLAGAQVSLRRLSDAEKSYEKILELDNDHPGARLGLGQVALLEARYKDALLLAGTLQTSHPDNAHGYVLQGDALAASGNPGEAIEAYQAALSRTPTSQLAIALSSAFRDSGQIVKAASFLNAWLAEYPNDNRVKAYLAESAMTAGHSDEAIVHYEQIIATSPNNITALNNLAYLYHERGDQRALEVSRRAYELAPNHPSIMDTYGWLLVQSGEFQKGVKILEESVNKGPENTEHRLHLGMALLKAGKPPAARDVFQALVNLESDFPEKAKAQELLELIE